jgi:hypothetical protein
MKNVNRNTASESLMVSAMRRAARGYANEYRASAAGPRQLADSTTVLSNRNLWLPVIIPPHRLAVLTVNYLQPN